MNCSTCGFPFPSHELWEGQCLRCVGKERDEFVEAYVDLYESGNPDIEAPVAEIREAAKKRVENTSFLQPTQK